MERLEFNPSDRPSLGVEIELALVDKGTSALTSACPDLLKALDQFRRGAAKLELMQCYVELNTDVCETVGQAGEELRNNLRAMQSVADNHNVSLLWSATHPFSSWQTQEVTEDQRYHGLVDLLQDTARQLITFGLHVHVGVDSGDKAVMICDRMLRHLPTLLAASCNSPFWENRYTGLSSWRTKVMEGLPTAGLPPFMRNWSEYVWLLNHLIHTGFIKTIREIWWDIRPHHNFGTVEVRICDMPGNLDDSMALVALIHCLVKQLSDSIDEGLYQHDCHPMLVRQNKWRAARYGLDAELVDSDNHQMVPVRQTLNRLVDDLLPISQELHCENELLHIRNLAKAPSWATRQLSHLKNSADDPRKLVHWMTTQSRV